MQFWKSCTWYDIFLFVQLYARFRIIFSVRYMLTLKIIFHFQPHFTFILQLFNVMLQNPHKRTLQTIPLQDLTRRLMKTSQAYSQKVASIAIHYVIWNADGQSSLPITHISSFWSRKLMITVQLCSQVNCCVQILWVYAYAQKGRDSDMKKLRKGFWGKSSLFINEGTFLYEDEEVKKRVLFSLFCLKLWSCQISRKRKECY